VEQMPHLTPACWVFTELLSKKMSTMCCFLFCR